MKKLLVTFTLIVFVIIGGGTFNNKDISTPDEPIHPPFV